MFNLSLSFLLVFICVPTLFSFLILMSFRKIAFNDWMKEKLVFVLNLFSDEVQQVFFPLKIGVIAVLFEFVQINFLILFEHIFEGLKLAIHHSN
jgi:hypothetical protein